MEKIDAKNINAKPEIPKKSYQMVMGRIFGAPRVVAYGVEGIGKSTFASKFPNPLVIDIEDRTRHISTNRIIPKDLMQVMEILDDMSSDYEAFCSNIGFKVETLVIDTIDWLQKSIIDYICNINKQPSIESFGYGKGWTLVAEWMHKIIKKLDAINRLGVIIVCVCHSTVKRFSDPFGNEYDRFTLKLVGGDKLSLIDAFKEWCDAMFFLNYNISKKGDEIIENRCIMTERTALYDAKNCYGLPPIIMLDEYYKIFEAMGIKLAGKDNIEE